MTQWTNIRLKPGDQLKCSTAFTFNQAGHQTLGVRLVLTMQSGRVLELETGQEPNFKFPALNAETPSVIEIAGKRRGEVSATARDNRQDHGRGPFELEFIAGRRHAIRDTDAQAPEQPDEQHLYELNWRVERPLGFPVDFAEFAKYWRDSGTAIAAQAALR